MRSLFSALLFAAVLPVVAAAQTEPQPDLTGKWTFTNQSSYGTSNPIVTFKQKGDSLTGVYSSASLGDHEFVGTIKKGKVSFGFDTEAGGMKFYMAFSGTLDGNDAIAGSIEAAGSDFGTFTAKRQKP
jgi:hypothetical protein